MPLASLLERAGVPPSGAILIITDRCIDSKTGSLGPPTMTLSTVENKLSTGNARLSTDDCQRERNLPITGGNKTSLGRDPVQAALNGEDGLLDG